MTTPTATIFLPWHALDEVHQRGTRAAQPAATDVVPGTLYSVTDETNLVERSTGTVWQPWGTARAAAIYAYDFSDQIIAPPTSSQVRLNAGAPYTAVTKVWLRFITNDGRDVYWGLTWAEVGAILLVQDKNDHTIHASFFLTAPPIDRGTYIEWPVTYRDSSGAALFNNQAVLVLKLS